VGPLALGEGLATRALEAPAPAEAAAPSAEAGEVDDHPGRLAERHLIGGPAVEVEQDRLARDDPARRRRECRCDPVDPDDREVFADGWMAVKASRCGL